MTWIRTEFLIKGKVIKPFLPNDKHPNLKNDNFKNLYPGDEVYIFEVKDSKWARVHAITKPLPTDYLASSINLDDLLVENHSVVVVPLSYIRILKEMPSEDIRVSKKFNNISDDSNIPTLRDSELAHQEAVDGEVVDKFIKKAIPPLPNKKDYARETLLDEIKHSLELLNAHIFAVYAKSEFRLFDKLTSIFYSLYETRLKLNNHLLTSEEAIVARETATFLLNKIPKVLASKATRLNQKSYDLDNPDTDVAGYKSILSRHSVTGEILSLETATPSRIALNNELGALVPSFPIHAHHTNSNYSLKPPVNKKFHHEPPSHILVDFKSVTGSSAYQPPGFAGMIAYMYLRNSRKRLTEAFAVHTNSVEDFVNVEKISAALFRNLPASETDNNRVYLVAVLTEEVDLSIKTSGHVPTIKRVKKGVAAGVADITRVFSRNEGALTSGEAHHFSIKLFGSFMNKKAASKNMIDDFRGLTNNGWGELVDRIIAGSSQGVAVNPRAEKLVITVKEFKHQFQGNAANQLTSSAPISRIKPIFFDPLAENYERIYLKMGKVSLLGNNNRDDLLTFEVSTPNNELITFAKASNQQEKRYWQFISVFAGESIGEIVKVNGVALKNSSKKLPKDDYIVLSLFINGVLVGEGRLLYKSGNRLVEFNKKKTHTIEIISTTHNVPMAHVELSTEYVGKIYNSDVSIDNIFQYERFFQNGQKGIDELSNSLVAFTRLDIAQLVKYFPELLSSLYGIISISSRHTGPSIEILEDNTFKAIIHLLDSIFGKQDQYLYLVDNFISKYKSSNQVGIFLLTKVEEVFNRAGSSWNAVSRSVCRVLSILLKLSITSMSSPNEHDLYLRTLNNLFKSIAYLLTLESPALIEDQILIMEIIDYVFAFRVNLDESKLVKIIINCINSIGLKGLGADELDLTTGVAASSTKDHKIIISKLLLVLRLLNTELIKDEESRSILLPKSITWVMDVFLGPTDVDATRLACSVLNAVATILWNNGNERPEDLEIRYSLTKFLPAIARTFIKYNKFTRGNGSFQPKRLFTQLFPSTYPFIEFSIDPIVNDETMVEVLIELATTFAFVARIGKQSTGDEGYSKIFSHPIENDCFVPEKYLAANFGPEDLITLISGIRYMRLGKYFPETKWFSTFAVIIEGCLCAVELIRPIILIHQLPSLDDSDLFDRVLWGNYLKTLFKLAVLPPVSVEHLSDVPKSGCSKITHDVRKRASALINEAWDSLAWESTDEDMLRFNLKKFGGYQVEFINNEYGILPDLMLLGLQRDSECQSVCVKILWSIMISEYILSDTLIEIEKQCLLGLYDIYHKNSYKPTLVDQNNFIERMKVTIRLDREDEAFEAIYGFIQNLQSFLGTLNYYISVPVGLEFKQDREFHELKLLSMIKNSGKPELFNSFINQLYERYIAKNDYVQAALSLEILASTYTWDKNVLLDQSLKPKFPQQSSFERKELILKMVASNFIKGNSLEKAADTYNELLDAYNEYTYDLKSFSYVHNKLAQLYLDLESSDELIPTYFRVEAIGGGFPSYLRKISQVFQGLPFEHITSVHERLLRMFPGAKIVKEDEEARKWKESTTNGRYLFVKTVEPVYEYSDKLFNASFGTRQYYRNKNLNCFSSLKKLDGATSQLDLWCEETTYKSFLTFPTLFNRSFISEEVSVKRNPLENAIKSIAAKNDELIQLESLIHKAIKEKSDYSNFLNDLSRVLSGSVDAPVNGGVGVYRAFFTDSRYQIDEESVRKVALLRDAFDDLAIILNKTLELHGRLIHDSMKLAHQALIDLFKQNFEEEIARLRLGEDATPFKTAPSSRISIFQDKRFNSQANERSSLSNLSAANSSSYAGSKLARSPTNASTVSSNGSSSNNRSGRTSGTSGYPSSNIQPGYTGLINTATRPGASASISSKQAYPQRTTAVNNGTNGTNW
ncbi:hypothetical protein G210_2071 [Candida maltosa Xu316]|uniref:DOCKER domain-containing protein n=1 Tax=Candida maltosa (strain Xu316) TaxID=1245528 RepID=M3K5U0_CANMX|nr:hypothetical protein G210_2071 [Candida maltosa Xu316]